MGSGEKDDPFGIRQFRTRNLRTPYFRIGLVSEDREFSALLDNSRKVIPVSGFGPEGFLIDANPERVILTANSLTGLDYGARKLRELTEVSASSAKVSGVMIADWPAMKRRGLHTLVRGKADLPAVKELISKHLPERRLNELILEINYFFEFKSHPEVAESGALSLADCRELRKLADRHQIRLIPMINCLGHQSWAKETFKLLTAHPEFDETPAVPKDNPGIYCRSWCPSHPRVHDFVADLCDELIDAFQADAFNVGMDEVFILGECDRCKGKPNAELFAKAVNDLHRRIVGKRKVEMQMWGDRLLDSKTTKYSRWEASDNGTAPAIDMIPKDIVICDWHYGVLPDYPSVKLFIDKGFRVWPAGWDSADNARNLASTGLRNNDEKMLGYMATTWLGAETTVKMLDGDETALKSHKSAPGIVAGINEGALVAWEGRP